MQANHIEALDGLSLTALASNRSLEALTLISATIVRSPSDADFPLPTAGPVNEPSRKAKEQLTSHLAGEQIHE